MTQTTVEIDPHAVTLGDIEDFALTTGGAVLFEAIDALSDQRLGELTAMQHTSLVWIFKRKTDPKFTREDARALRPADVQYVAVTAEET